MKGSIEGGSKLRSIGRPVSLSISPGLTMPSPSEPKPFFSFFPVSRKPSLSSFPPRLALLQVFLSPIASQPNLCEYVLQIGTTCPGTCLNWPLFLAPPLLHKPTSPSLPHAQANPVQTLLRSASVAPSAGRSIPARCTSLMISIAHARPSCNVFGELETNFDATSFRQRPVRHLQAYQVWRQIHCHSDSRYAVLAAWS